MGLSEVILIFTDMHTRLPHLSDDFIRRQGETDKRLEDRQIYIPILD
jgi:hypothetical protein